MKINENTLSNAEVIDDRIKKLQSLMRERDIDMYYIPTSDFHQSEIVASYFKCRKFMTGFTGSAGSLLVTSKDAMLWVDGRYFLQAEIQLKGTCIRKMEIGEPGVPSIEQYIRNNLKKGGVVGFDGRVVGTAMAERIAEAAASKNGNISIDEDLVDIIWDKRPAIGKRKGWLLEEKYAGEKSSERLLRFKNFLLENGYSNAIVTKLDDVAWLTNIRGDDIRRIPLMFAFFVIAEGEYHLFIDSTRIETKLKENLEITNVHIHQYNDIYTFVETLKGENVLTDLDSLNYTLYQSIPPHIEVLDKRLPLEKWKSVKNHIQIDNIRKVHVKDGVAQTRFIFWLKHCDRITEVDEFEAGRQLLKYRSQQEGFISESFATISAYGPNGAIIHYSPERKGSRKLEKKGLLLVDSGGQYCGGTTDATRTIALGPVSSEEKKCYTLVLKGMIRLAMTKFLYGCTGRNLDILARMALWNENLDYKHGTGHGIGYMSNVHEGENNIRWRKTPYDEDLILEEGMITSDEPGYYEDAKFGIRLENATLVQKDIRNIYGQFMKLETLTLVPFERDAIDLSLMDDCEIAWLDEYHKRVYEVLNDKLSEEERIWLKEVTSPLRKKI